MQIFEDLDEKAQGLDIVSGQAIDAELTNVLCQTALASVAQTQH